MADNHTHDILRVLVEKATCKPGWSFRLLNEDGALRLTILVDGYNSDTPNERIAVRHYFPVPTATYNRPTWRRWLFEQCRGVENHELSEWFKIDGERPYPPLHGPGENPYVIHEFRDPIDGRTRQDGSLRQET